YGGSAGEWSWHRDDHLPSHDRQRPGTHFRVRQHPGERQHHPGFRPQLSGPGGFPTQCGVGPDAEHAPAIDLREYLGAYPARRDDFFDLDGIQPAQRWPAGCHGCEAVKETDVVQSEGPNGPAPTQWRQGPNGPAPTQSRQALLTVSALRKYFPVRGG